MKHFTKHGERRAQQRGISMSALMTLDAFGVDILQKGGTIKVELPCNRDERQQLRNDLKTLLILLDKDVYSIESDMQDIITVCHKH